MDELDAKWLRRSFELAAEALLGGDYSYGALLVDSTGGLLMEARQTRVTTGDCTGHAEMNVVREASRRWARDFLADCTLYSSTEPCPMCAGAFAWSGVGRLVFGVSQERYYREFPDASPPRFIKPLSCRALLENVQPPVVVVGPLLEEEALLPHRRWWDLQQ